MLAAHDLTLTQGGEPTFVPHDTSAPEWGVAALGPQKLLYARKLARELAARQFPGAVILQSFGKQYPNEPLPRWQVSLYRARSGPPLWHDLDRLRLEQTTIAPTAADQPEKFIRALASALRLKATPLPAYEDLEAKLHAVGSAEAKRLLPRFSRRQRAFISHPLPAEGDETWQAYFQPAGWVLPLGHDGKKWTTGVWELPTGEDLTLIPGDSPIGLRLPLTQLKKDALRTGLTVECKDDELILFLPPLPSFATFCTLVRTIETLVTELGLPPIRLEGYNPPGDEDAESIALTSDPGVLEVNLPPAANWPDFERVIRGLYASAESIGLRGFKYQLSGRQVSTGGGAHIILGGPSIAENPFIARPDLLSSFLRFLQHHPALSYVFSGLFTGPSSQAPRIDESAYELPYEMEITLQALDTMARPGDPVVIDALLRNLLMDWNGNTHRAELSVDKFYNYHAANGQNGLIEFRAFEMVPEPDALLGPNLLLRALTACFAQKPYSGPLVDWQEQLHDRFALPGFLRQDLHAIVAYLNAHGFSLPADAFDAQLDFRFPRITEFKTGRTHWTLRHALEPWPVMGEHEGTGRVVDSTTDRLELAASTTASGEDYVVTVNGYRLPLRPLDGGGVVGAIRYRLFDNPWGLQPHIKAHTPLRIVILDTKTRRVVHALDYHNWRRAGVAYDGVPTTAAAAAARVAERVQVPTDLIGSPGEVLAAEPSPRAPYTLDLRRFPSSA